MIRKKIIPVLIAIGMLPGLLAACGDIRANGAPTKAPSPGQPGESDEQGTETAYKDYTKILELDGENEAQFESLALDGGKLSQKKTAYQGSFSFCVSKRESSLQGVTLNFMTRNNEWIDVVGKKAYFGVWVYHATGKEETFRCSLQAKTMENTVLYPATKEQQVPSGVWTLLELAMEVPSNVKSPVVWISMSSSDAAFYMDALCLSYDPSSKVGAYAPPTVAPTVTGKAPEKTDTSKFTLLQNLTADKGEAEKALFQTEGAATLFIGSNGNKGNGYSLTGCGTEQGYAALGFTGSDGKPYDVCGKDVYVSFWAYQETGAALDVQAKLCVTKPNGEEVVLGTIHNRLGESGTWGFAEGVFSLYANVTDPQVRFVTEGDGNAVSFCLDDIILMVNRNSDNPANEEYENEVVRDLEKLTFDFEGNTMLFAGTGDAVVSVTKGGHDSARCLRVGKRSSLKDGAQLRLDGYHMEGRSYTVSYWIYQESPFPISVSLSAQKLGSTATERITVIDETELNAGKWVKLTGTISFEEDVTGCVLFFEANDRSATFYLDDFVIERVP